MPQESQNCLHSPDMAPPAGQCQPAGIWVEFGPSCSGRCLRLDSSSVAGSPAAAVQPEAAGNRAALFWDCDGAPGRLAAAEISAPLVDVLFAFPPMIRQSSNHHTKFRTTDGASECLIIAVVVLLKWGRAINNLYFSPWLQQPSFLLSLTPHNL